MCYAISKAYSSVYLGLLCSPTSKNALCLYKMKISISKGIQHFGLCVCGHVIGVGRRAVKRVKGPVLCSYIHFPTLDRELSALKQEGRCGVEKEKCTGRLKSPCV